MNDDFKNGFKKIAGLGEILTGTALAGGVLGLGALLGKASKSTIDDVEDHMGVHVPSGAAEDYVNSLLDKERGQSFVAKNPGLMGAVSMGIAPAIVNSGIVDRVSNATQRKFNSIRSAVAAADEVRRKEHLALMQERIADREARARERMVGMGSHAALGIARTLANRDRE